MKNKNKYDYKDKYSYNPRIAQYFFFSGILSSRISNFEKLQLNLKDQN